MRISIASGKGGTGKTTIAVNMALSLPDAMLIDCDVEEPNCHIFFDGEMVKLRDVNIPVPNFDLDKCTLCGKCAEFCQYNAIAIAGEKLLFFDELCHGCGGCRIVCPEDAITEVDHQIGVIEKGGMKNLPLYHGILNIGEPFGVPIIRELKKFAEPSKTTILDAPPGTACPAVETMSGSDFCILVTEPTPFGLHDLKLTVDIIRELRTPFGVVVNRDGIGDDRIERYCSGENIPLLAKIPNDLQIARLYSRGVPILEGMPEFKATFAGIYEKIREMV
ncbi:MAG: ATP-binding protein [Candidatus Thermoplasmatota archaeon]